MTMSATSRDGDARSAVSLYSEQSTTTTRLAASVGGEAPWGAPDGLHVEATTRRLEVIDSTLKQLAALLDVVQPAHRKGDLAPLDLEDLHRAQAWYSRLQAEHDRMGIAKEKP
jgi:hypothetical protein